jgi:hypothetical protein
MADALLCDIVRDAEAGFREHCSIAGLGVVVLMG